MPDTTRRRIPLRASADVGQVVADRYRLLESVGQGGMGAWLPPSVAERRKLLQEIGRIARANVSDEPPLQSRSSNFFADDEPPDGSGDDPLFPTRSISVRYRRSAGLFPQTARPLSKRYPLLQELCVPADRFRERLHVVLAP
jgi:hypothetical protein